MLPVFAYIIISWPQLLLKIFFVNFSSIIFGFYLLAGGTFRNNLIHTVSHVYIIKKHLFMYIVDSYIPNSVRRLLWLENLEYLKKIAFNKVFNMALKWFLKYHVLTSLIFCIKNSFLKHGRSGLVRKLSWSSIGYLWICRVKYQ